MTWNIQHGSDGTENIQADFIVAQQPDVVILQEVNTPNHHTMYRDLLVQKTGRPWNVAFMAHCEHFRSSLDPDGNPVCDFPDNDGVAILTHLPFQDVPTGELLWGRDGFTDARRVLRVKVRVGTQDVQVFGTHLAAGPDFEHIRINQMRALVAWMNRFSGPRLLGGDLNAVPGPPPSEPIRILSEAGYVDAWAALKSGEAGFTHNARGSLTRRIDYWFSQSGSAAQPSFVDRPLFPAGPLSDHLAVVAVYTITDTGSSPLVGHWKLDDGTGSPSAADSSGNANGTLINHPVWTTGPMGGALRFDGTNHVSIPNQTSWNKVSSKYTVAFWVRVDQIRDYAGAVAIGPWGTGMLEIMTTGNQWSARVNTSGGPNGWDCDVTSSTLGYLQTREDRFHHVALVLDAAASRCVLYSDGQLVGTDEYVDGMTSFGNESLNIGGFANANRLPGVIDDVRLYNAALTQAEVQELANTGPDITPPSVTITAPVAGTTVSGSTTVTADAFDNVSVAGVQFKLDGQPLGLEDTSSPYSVQWNTASATNGSHDLTAVARDTAGNIAQAATVTVTVDNTPDSRPLVGHWKLDDGTGSPSAFDSTGNGANGTLINNPVWTTGPVGGALRFDGTNQVSIPNQSSWNKVSSKYTVAFWIRVDAIRDYAGAVAIGPWGTRMLEIMTTGGQWSFRINTVGGTNGWACEGASSTLGYLQTREDRFHHVALVLDAAASRCFLYSDGQLVATDEYVDGTTSFGNESLNLGGFANTNRLPSVIDDVRLYNAALTQAEVQALMGGSP